jgi:hypothetical protein
MSWLDDVRDGVVGVIQKVIDIAVDVLTAVADAFAMVGHDLVSLSEYFRTALEKSIGAVLPDSVARLVTLTWYLLEINVSLGAGFVSNLSNALKTGHIDDLLSVMKPASVSAMLMARNEAIRQARPLPPIVAALLPDEQDRVRIAECRFTVLDRIGRCPIRC